MEKFTRQPKKCEVENCYNVCYKHKYCRNHQTAYLKYGDPLFNKRKQNEEVRQLIICSVENCNRKSNPSGYCTNHNNAFKKEGDPEFYDKQRAFYKSIRASKTDRSYEAMKTRCNSDKRYIEKGITVCERWNKSNGLLNFVADMGLRPEGKYSLDRIDNSGNYTPENCRWATDKTQVRNRDLTKMIEHEGILIPLAEFCEKFSLDYNFARYRYNAGLSSDEILKNPKRQNRYINYNNETLTITKLCNKLNINVSTMINALKNGKPLDEFIKNYKPASTRKKNLQNLTTNS